MGGKAQNAHQENNCTESIGMTILNEKYSCKTFIQSLSVRNNIKNQELGSKLFTQLS